MDMAVHVVCLSVFFLPVIHGFNVDTKWPIFKQGPSSSYFGYSVAQHSRDKIVYDQALIGAPLAGSSSQNLKNYLRTGALYHCTVDIKNPGAVEDCDEFQYPDTDPIRDDLQGTRQNNWENKTDMWLGVSVRSSSDFVIGCGHRYKVEHRDTNVYGLGICYIYHSNYDEYDLTAYKSPCIGEALQDGNNAASGAFGICAAGMSIDALNHDVVYGVPGAGSWRGTTIWQSLSPDVSDVSIFKILPVSTNVDLNSYLGSSTVIAHGLIVDESKKVAVLGAPRENDNGTVHIFELTSAAPHIQFHRKFSGPQFASSFGHSVAVIDILGNGHPSLVVGAPLYRSIAFSEGSRKKSLLGGAICVFYNNGDGIRLKHVLITPGECQHPNAENCINAQFGYSLASLGDINGDGYHDLAVGAPYYGQGAVFIFSGTKDGLLATTPTQVILASQLDSRQLRAPVNGLGVSLSGGKNMDGQGYTDILVGAHRSSHVVLLRSRPVVNINGVLRLKTSVIDPEKTDCDENRSAGAPCISFDVCFSARFGTNSPSSTNVLITYNLTVDSGYDLPIARRVVFDMKKKDSVDSVRSANHSQTLNSGEICRPVLVYIAHIRDLLRPIKVDLSYRLIVTDVRSDELDRFYIMNSSASLNPSDEFQVQFKKDCKFEKCHTDIGVLAAFSNPEVIIDPESMNNDEFVFNSDKVDKLQLTFNLTVDNSPESPDPAYEPSVYVALPAELSSLGEFTSKNPAVSCSDILKENAVICGFGKKLKEGTEVEVTIKLNPRNLGPTYSQINITANTTSSDSTKMNNVATLRVKVVIVTDLELVGSATKGERVKYGGDRKGSTSIKTDAEIGDLVQHTYSLSNVGSGKVSKVSVTILWPWKIASDRYLLYVINKPRYELDKESSVQAQCAYNDEYINKENYRIVEEDTAVSTDGRRNKREVVKQTSAIRTLSEDGTTKRVAVLNCFDGTAKCINITCEFLNFGPGAVARIRLNARLWNTSLIDEFGDAVALVRISSFGTLYIDPSAKVSQQTVNDRVNVTTEAESENVIFERKPVPIWIIIVASIGGILILIVIILIMWKCGFFKRHRHMTQEVKVEKQDVKYQKVPVNEPDQRL